MMVLRVVGRSFGYLTAVYDRICTGVFDESDNEIC